MMELTPKSRKQILDYLRTTSALKHDSVRSITFHLSKLENWDQFEAEEDIDGNLVYATAWWKVTDKALEDIKNGIPPKRFNRGRNLVGFFWLQPQAIGVGQMKRIIKRVMRMERAQTLHIMKPNGKWFGIKSNGSHEYKPWQRMKRKKVAEVMDILTGGKQCPQQSHSE